MKTNGHLKQMIQMIDDLKRRLKEQDEANRKLQNLCNAKSALPTDAQEKNLQLVSLKARCDEVEGHQIQQRKKLDTLNAKVLELNVQLQEQRENNCQQTTKIRNLEMEI